MASTYTSSACQTLNGFFLNPAKVIETGMVVRSATIPIPISASNTAVIQMVPVPTGAHIVDVIFAWDTAGTTTQLTVNVGDGNSTGRFLTSFSATGSGSVRMGIGNAANTYGALGYSYSVEDTIDIYVSAVASGSTTPAGNIRLTVLYAMDQAMGGSS